MKAWHFYGTGKAMELVELPEPEPGEGEVLLDIGGSGLCHTDVGVLEDEGWMPMLTKLPMVIGHEVAGTVRRLGAGVSGCAVGDRVGVCPTTSAGAPGFAYDGGFAEQMIAPAQALVPIPDDVSFAAGATATDAGMTSHHAMMTSGALEPGMKVGVIGLGGLGQIGSRVAVLQGAEVFVAEIDESVWHLADELGVKQISNSIVDFADKDLDLIVDYAGFGTTTAQAIETVARGGRVVQVGMGKLEATISTKAMILNKVTLVGSNGGTKEDIEGIYRLLSSGDLRPVLTEIGIDEIADGLHRLSRGEVTGRLVAVPRGI